MRQAEPIHQSAAPPALSHSSFMLCHSFVIGHLAFVISLPLCFTLRERASVLDCDGPPPFASEQWYGHRVPFPRTASCPNSQRVANPGARHNPNPAIPLCAASSALRRHSSFVIRHSSFDIRHSSFVIRHSSFVIRHSSFVIRHSSFVISRPQPSSPQSCVSSPTPRTLPVPAGATCRIRAPAPRFSLPRTSQTFLPRCTECRTACRG